MAVSKILVVEDECAVRELLAATLIGAGYAVLEAADGSAAQLLVEDRNPSLI